MEDSLYGSIKKNKFVVIHMNILELSGLEEVFLGIYLMAHGGIHLIFLFDFYDEEKKIHTGWIGRSWLLEKVLPLKMSTYIGKILWIMITGFFVSSGLVVLDILPLDDVLVPLILIGSTLAIITFIISYNGLMPTPYHWILGVIIDLSLITFLVFLPNEIIFLLLILVLVFIWAVLFHNRVIPQPKG